MKTEREYIAELQEVLCHALVECDNGITADENGYRNAAIEALHKVRVIIGGERDTEEITINDEGTN